MPDVRIGLISDTHGQFRPEIADVFAGVDLIVHAGDVGRADVLRARLLSVPFVRALSSPELGFVRTILPRELVGPCFIGFAIGESLGASVLRICGGIFTKIADIGSDLMKIVFKLPEDDPKNPGVIADCTGDNAGDSVGPTADGFETYGVTGVALIAFLALALTASTELCALLIVWLFTMRALMIVTSLVSYFINEAISKAKYAALKDFHEEAPLTWLVWITSVISILVTFAASKWLLGGVEFNGTKLENLWWALSVIISCGTIAGALIPEFTKVFTSTTCGHNRNTGGVLLLVHAVVQRGRRWRRHLRVGRHGGGRRGRRSEGRVHGMQVQGRTIATGALVSGHWTKTIDGDGFV